MRDYKIYVDDALEMIKRIEKSGNKNLKTQDKWDATLMRLQVIGESVKKIPKEIKKNYPIKWEKFENLRNFISHSYTRVFPKIVVDIIVNEIPELKKELVKMKNEK